MQLIYFIVRFQRIVTYFSFMYQQGIGMPLLPPANEVWGKVIFLHLFIILFTGGGAWSGGVPGPRGVHGPGGAWWRPPRRLLLRAVRILLECILVYEIFSDRLQNLIEFGQRIQGRGIPREYIDQDDY